MDDGTWTTLYERSLLDAAGAWVALLGGGAALLILALAPLVLFGRKPRHAYWDARQVKMTLGAALVTVAIGAFGAFMLRDALRATFSSAETFDGTTWTRHIAWSKRNHYFVNAGLASCDVGQSAYEALQPGDRIRLVRRAERALSLAVWRPAKAPATNPASDTVSVDR
jgi:hypothetical protein